MAQSYRRAADGSPVATAAETYERIGVGHAVGTGFAMARAAVARGLIAIGVRPNALTVLGFLFTAAAGVFLAMGAGDQFHGRGPWGQFLWDRNPQAYRTLSPWNLWAALMLILCGATDMLDGAVARLGNMGSKFGAFLDSTLDRFSDFFIFAGIGVYYAWRGNVTYSLLAMLCISNAFAISYTRARAETLIPRCRVGYWQRGERIAGTIIALFAYNVPALLWLLAVGQTGTVARRVSYTYQVSIGRTPAEHPRDGTRLDRIQLWRWPRMTWQYDLMTGLHIAFLLVAPIPQHDLLRTWLS